MNTLTLATKVTLLLCGILGNDSSVKPLSNTEYRKILQVVQTTGIEFERLLSCEELSTISEPANIDTNRLENLLSRGVKLGFAVEEWQRNGIWIISQSDEEYPKYYKKHLADRYPPIIFGIGDVSLLNSGGIAVVGSRTIDEHAENFTREFAKLCSFNQITVVSGGARGVDQIIMEDTIKSEGSVVGVLADNLLKKSLESTVRIALNDGNLVLISPFNPKAGFTIGTAMARNKLIYGLSDYAVVVNADYKKGGTWAGAVEEIKRDNSIPVFVRYDENVPKGNKKLVEVGAIPLSQKIEGKNLLNSLKNLAGNKSPANKPYNLTLFSFNENKKDA